MTSIKLTPKEVQRIACWTGLLKTKETNTIEIEVREGSIGHGVDVIIDGERIQVTDYEAW